MVRAMLAAPVIDIPPDSRRPTWPPLVLSALLHLVLALVWLGFPVPQHQDDGEQAMVVELTPPPAAPPPAAAERKPPQPAQPQATEQGTPIPQLEDGMLAQRSSTPKLQERSAEAPVTARPEPKQPAKPKKPEPVTQNERDFVLGQVLRHWAPPRELSAYAKADVRLTVIVQADGYFADLYDARRPWNPAAAFDGYASLPPDDLRRRTIDAFLTAIRKAQPVRLPAALQAKAPFQVRLDFRFRDAR